MSLNILLFITMHQEIMVPVTMKIMAKTMAVLGLLWSKPPQQTRPYMKSSKPYRTIFSKGAEAKKDRGEERQG